MSEQYCQACQMYHMPEQWYVDQIEKSAGITYAPVVTQRENNIRFLERHRENVKDNEGEQEVLA